MNSIISRLFAFFVLVQTCTATSIYRAERARLNLLMREIESFYNLNERDPNTWEEFRAYLGTLEDDSGESLLFATFEERYFFSGLQGEISHEKLGGVVLLNRRPFREKTHYQSWFGGLRKNYRERGRYVLFRHESGRLLCMYCEEDFVRRIYTASGNDLPKSKVFPFEPSEVGYYFGLFLRFSVLLVIGAIGLKFVKSKVSGKIKS